MTAITEIYKLRPILDNPMYEGFAFADDCRSLFDNDDLEEDFLSITGAGDEKRWRWRSLKKRWKPVEVEGRVAAFHDFPSGSVLTFSERAVKALGKYLTANGELLPLKPFEGRQYFAFHLKTVVEIIDRNKSTVTSWFSDTFANHVPHIVLKKDLPKSLSIFYMSEIRSHPVVSDSFVQCVRENGLNGFDFSDKMYPMPKGTDWRMEAARKRNAAGKKIKLKGKSAEIKGQTLVIFLQLAGAKPSAKERKRISQLEDELDEQLVISSLDDPYFGSLEGSDIVDGDMRLFLSCPDVDRLAKKLQPWMKAIEWPGELSAVKRYCEIHEDGKEVQMSLK